MYWSLIAWQEKKCLKQVAMEYEHKSENDKFIFVVTKQLCSIFLVLCFLENFQSLLEKDFKNHVMGLLNMDLENIAANIVSSNLHFLFFISFPQL